MNDKIMSKATFSEICKIMKGDKTDVWECISGLFGISLLFFPGLICKETAVLTNISNGVALLSAQKEIESAIRNIPKTFKNKQYADFSTKYEHAQIAHILIVFAAYFDSIKMYLPNEEKKIELSPKEKFFLADEAINKYIKFLEEGEKHKPEAKAKEVLEYDLSLPDPIVNLDRYSKRLKDFYVLLNQEFMVFFEKLSFWEMHKEVERDSLLAVLRKLPDKAVENYQKQYYELAVNFNDFFVWTNIQEHEKIQKSIDVGFSAIAEQIQTYYEKTKDLKAIETLNKYERKYQAYIKKPIIDTSEMDYDSSGEVVFPNKDIIFVPQRFKALIYKNNMQLEQEVWKEYEERDNIGKFISDILRHSKVGELPLLILGLPGAGKSLLCNMLAAKILFHEYHVIIIKLRDTIADETINQQINQQMKRDFSNSCTWDDIAESGINKPVLLIFDGYDELLQASGRTYSDYIKKIAEFQKDQKSIYNIFVKCIVTSRTTLIDKALIMDNTPVIRLSDFDAERIDVWSKIWNENNKIFFQKNQLDYFEIDKRSKVYELAKQPLLLMMLALYDSNGNTLKKQRNMNSTQLYYSLIREFISREKRKSEKFRSKQESEQQKIIDEEVRKISIAAIGMYNRRALYIRSIEFQSDIEFIEEKYENGTRDTELKESDIRIGSFLFIHKSKSTGIIEKEQIKDAAYEFLHNTFGEFLTAYFIVSEIFKILNLIRLLLTQDMKYPWNLSDHRAWCLCLSYAPLFSRPVVVEMIHEWSSSYLESKGMTNEEVEKSMDFLINMEIHRTINGDDLFALKEIVEKKGNPFKQEEMLKHLAIYSLNIVILRTIVCTSEHSFKFENDGIWNKLVCLWKFAFSNDELSDYANIFLAVPKEDTCLIRYNSANRNINNQQNGVDKLFKSYLALGDELTYSIMGALIGNGEKDKIIDAMSRSKLDIKARYIWNYILKILNQGNISQYEIVSILEKYSVYCQREGDEEYIFAYYLLVNFLLKKKIIRYDDDGVKRFLLNEILFGYNDYGYMERRFDRRGYLAYLTMELSLDILDYIMLRNDEIERIFMEFPDRRFRDRFMYEYNLEFTLRFYNIIVRKLVYRGDSETVAHILRRGYFEENIEKILWNCKKNDNIQRIFGEIIELSYNFMLLGEIKVCERLIAECLEILCHQGLEREVRISMKQKNMFIKSLYEICQNESMVLMHYRRTIRIILYNVTVRKVFQESEETAIKLCKLEMMGEILNRNRVREDLMWIANAKGIRISEEFCKEIYAIADSFRWDELKLSLRDKRHTYK